MARPTGKEVPVISLNLKNDIIFKAVYGRENNECKQALIAVLNLVLDRTSDPITKITYKNPFNTREKVDQKESVMDIKAETNSNEIIDLEIHLFYDDDFVPRNIYYHSGMIMQSLAPGEKYGKIKKTISIHLVDFLMFDETDRYHTIFGMLEKQQHFLLTDRVEMHYLELPKVNSKRLLAPNQLNRLERYLEYLRYAGDPKHAAYLEKLKLQGGKEIAMTEKLLKQATADEIVREQAIARDKFLFRQYCLERQHEERMKALEAAEEAQKAAEEGKKAAEEGKKAAEEGKKAAEEGKKAAESELLRTRRLTAKNLLNTGMGLPQIAEIMGISETTLEELLALN